MKKYIIILVTAMLGQMAMAQSMEEHRLNGEGLMNNSDFAGALAEFQKAMKLDESTTGNGILYSYAGICAFQTQMNDEAKSYFQKAIDRGFQDEKVFELYGSILSKEKDYPAQVALYTKGAELFPENGIFYKKKICNAYYYGKEYDKVEPLATEILAADATDTKVRLQYANALMRQKKQKEAVAAYEELLKYDEENLTANKYLGNYNYQVGKAQADRQNKKYEAIAKPTRVQWTDNNKKLAAIYGKYYTNAAKYLETAYAQKEEAGTKKMLNVIYTKLGDKTKAAQYE